MRTLAAILVLPLALPACVRAQEVTGTILGTVTDPSGAAIARARIAVTATDKGLVVRNVESDANGDYVAALLPVGQYTLTADAKGFKKLIRSGIELHVEEKLTVPLPLQVGDVSEQMTVEASAAQVELQTPAAGGLVSGTEVREIALNNRNYLELLILMPGVVSNSGSDELPIGAVTQAGTVNALPFSFNGGRTTGNNFMVDGADNMDRGANQTLLATPSVDAIAEFKALRGVYSAEFGRSASGQVNVITKSGTSQFHADAHEFFRNDVLAANDFFSNAHSIPRPPLRYNNFGYTLGGPIVFPGHYNKNRNKTFFFWSQEFRRIITYGSTTQSTVPTADMKLGIFSAPVCVQYNAAGTTCQQTANRIANINPVAAAYIKDVWSKIPSGNPADFTLFSIGRILYNFREELIKIDHNFGPKLALSFRYMTDAVNTQEAGGYQVNSPLPGISTSATNTPGRGTMARATSSLTPSLLNEAGFAYSYGAKLSGPIGLDGAAMSPDVKVTLPYPSTLGRIPALAISQLTSITGFGPYVNYNRNFNWFDNLTKISGRHTLKLGVAYNYYQKTENSANTNAGTFTFSSTPRPTGTPQAMQNWANFLLGNVTTFAQTSIDLQPDMRMSQFEAYAQDDIRLWPNFTLDVGVRYSLFRLPFDNRHMLTNFDPLVFDPKKAPRVDPATGNIAAGTGDPLNGVIDNSRTSPYGDKVSNEPGGKFAPRVGFAWDPFGNGKTAIRSGYGIAYDSSLVGMYENNIFSNPPYLNNITISNTRLDDPSAGVPVVSAAPKTLRGTPLPSFVPYTQQWSFDVQREATRTFILDVGYYGSKGTHLLGIVDLNEVPPGAAVAAGIVTSNTPINSTLTPRLNLLRPYQGYGPVNSVENWFNSSYHSLQVSAQKRLSGYSALRMAYSFSKVLTDATSDRNNAPQNTYNRSAEKARALFDRTHVLTVSYVYELPFARHSGGAAQAVLGGWQLSGVTSFVSGLPLRVTSSYGLDWGGLGLLAAGTQAAPRPDMLADPNAKAPHTVAQWFNTQAFGPVPGGQARPGNAPASSVIGPGYQQWDVSLMRNIRIREKGRLQIRGEAFNFLNHTNPSAVATAAAASNFGQITSAREPRRIQLALKLGF
jgi:hypothetical protein